IHSWAARRPLKYIGYGGVQVRDVLHPKDLVPLPPPQMQAPESTDHTGKRDLQATEHTEHTARRDMQATGHTEHTARRDLQATEHTDHTARRDLQATEHTDHTARKDPQATEYAEHTDRIFNVAGGAESAASLRRVSDWCAARFGAHTVTD